MNSSFMHRVAFVVWLVWAAIAPALAQPRNGKSATFEWQRAAPER